MLLMEEVVSHSDKAETGRMQEKRGYSVFGKEYEQMLRYDHVHNNGWTDIGYHFYITLDGVVHACRPVERMGSHALGYNAHSIGICYEGGLSPSGCISDTRTPKQKESMKHLIQELHHRFPGIRTILGHRDLPGVQKACPCFDATKLQCHLDAS